MRVFLAALFFFFASLVLFEEKTFSQTMDELQAFSRYTTSASQWMEGARSIIEKTAELDDLAAAISDKKVDVNYGFTQSKKMVVPLRHALTLLKKERIFLSKVPKIIKFEKFLRSLKNTQIMMDLSLNAAEESIEASEKLIAAAIDGDPKLYKKIEAKSLLQTIGMLRQQSGTMQMEMGNHNTNSPLFSMYGSYLSYLLGVIELTESMLRAVEMENFSKVDFADSAKITKNILDKGYSYTRKGRRYVRDYLKMINAFPEKTPKDVSNKLILIEAYTSYFSSYEIIEKLFELVERFSGDLIRFNFDIPENQIDDLTIAMTILEKEFANSDMQRQRLIGQMRK
jgi:hypothetical protein